ncbi:hypothetical protein G647_10111 [Cladophialophora carrionii CBS 160.54]|uniref:Major facilitator superfamily (MFS) profile domain-containing protein n=1 Tax=Cladophialophora carrionii CBS 160.54 TaxID=1279043 RepID=V9DM27_9EURO|nr:uncharacterized protein G647_10111 [Cladophialophora carrionii CBS 160.54]ETI27012.1 hypothetical protein G647_10111 [Cladophialophora carrionii CBS 160.54]
MPALNSAEKEVKPMAPSPNDEVGTLDAKESQAENALIRKLDLYIKRKDSKRAAAVYIAVTLSGAFGGRFAWVLTQIDGVPGYAGWRWTFFVEGAISSCLACANSFLFPNAPETARFLNPDEKRLAQFLARFRIESQDKDVPLRWSQVVVALKPLICWLSGFIQLCAGVYYHPLSIFLPTILTRLGYGSLQTQYLTIPVYLFATVMCSSMPG